ncbi:MAG: uroporphyrinogen-III synthase [Legionellaceae bacterium]|nr:uroporphyrinogen-III synthase [Legionellaceae bacterium]
MHNLNHLRVLNTRPEQQASSLTQAIEEAGGISVNLPLLEIKPIPIKINLNHIHAAIFTSPNAVHCFFASLASQHWPHEIQYFAIGQGTADALMHYGLSSATCPQEANSEHLLMLDALQYKQIQHKNILLIKGQGGRTLIQTALSARGAEVDIREVYQRVLPHHSKKRIETLWHEDAVDIILITSETALVHLFELFAKQAHAWLCSKPYVVISERLRQAAHKRGIKTVLVSSYDRIIHQLLSYSSIS